MLQKVRRLGSVCTGAFLLAEEYQAHRVRYNELSDLEGFVMSPGQDIPAAIENQVTARIATARRTAPSQSNPAEESRPRHFLRGSIVGAAIGVTLHDIILPVVPLLLGWEYDVGYWLLSHPHELPPRLRLSHQSPAIWFH
jgi:hypothetical protein